MDRGNGRTYYVPKVDPPEKGESKFGCIIIALAILFLLAGLAIVFIPA